MGVLGRYWRGSGLKSGTIGLGVVAAAFALAFGGFGGRLFSMDDNTAATVGSQRISMRQVVELAQQLDRQNNATTEAARSANLRSALAQLVQTQVLVEEGYRMGFGPTDPEVARWVKNVPAFQNESKKFDKTLYNRFIKSGQMSELELFQQARESLVLQKVGLLLNLPAPEPVGLVEERAQRDGTGFFIDIVALKADPKDMEAQVEAAATAFLEKPENLPVLEKAYQAAFKEFNRPRRVKVRTVLVAHKGSERAQGDALKRTEQEARALAEGVLKKAQQGSDFTVLASQTNDDAKAKAQKGDLGFVDETSLDPQSAEAALALTATKPLSEVVVTPFGFRIFKLEEVQDARSSPLEEVKGELAKRTVRAQVEGDGASVLRSKVTPLLGDKVALETGLKDLKLSWVPVSQPINPSTSFVPELGLVDTLKAQLFALHKPGDILGQVVDLGGKLFLIKLRERRNPEPMAKGQQDAMAVFANYQQSQMVRLAVQKSLIDTYRASKTIKENTLFFK